MDERRHMGVAKEAKYDRETDSYHQALAECMERCAAGWWQAQGFFHTRLGAVASYMNEKNQKSFKANYISFLLFKDNGTNMNIVMRISVHNCICEDSLCALRDI